MSDKQYPIMVNGITKNQHHSYHKKVHRKAGKAYKCENPECSHKNPKRFEWALRKGHQYSSNPDDYIQLCVSCHRKYDFNESIRNKLKKKKNGDANNNAKLSNFQVLEILALINAGKQNLEIAKLYKIHPTTICDIKRGKRWGIFTGIKYNKNEK